MISKKKYDLKKIEDIAFNDLEKLLNEFDIEYTSNNDGYSFACPIHDGSDNKNGCSISLSKKRWICWTRGCHEVYKKNIFGFVIGILSKKEKDFNFKKALNYIIKLYDLKKITLEKEKEVINNENEIVSISKIFKKIETKNSIEINPIKLDYENRYFLSRGFSKLTLQYFGVGECYENCSMKNRAVIPILNKENVLVGYIGRATKPYIVPKFLYSKGFRKSEHLYNLNNAIKHIQDKSSAFIVEGQGDVWRMHEAGIYNCVGIFGKELSEIQKNLLLESGITNLIILLDDDQPGREAKFKIQRQLNRLFTLKFPQLLKKDIGEMSINDIISNILPQVKGHAK